MFGSDKLTLWKLRIAKTCMLLTLLRLEIVHMHISLLDELLKLIHFIIVDRVDVNEVRSVNATILICKHIQVHTINVVHVLCPNHTPAFFTCKIVPNCLVFGYSSLCQSTLLSSDLYKKKVKPVVVYAINNFLPRK